MGKWYMHPAGKEYDDWLPRAMQRETKINTSLPQNEPEQALPFGPDQMLFPLVDAGPDAPFGKDVERTVDVDSTTATALYTYRDKPVADVKAQLLDAAAAKRYEVEFGGTTFNGSPLATDTKTQAALTAAYVKAQADPNYTIGSWKSGPGTFSTLDAPTIIALADAIEAHVQACFTREAAIAGEIAAATTLAELAAINIESGWP
ncbi:MAG: DUF4376 domain-containing protein [Sulfitobacter sp.]|uniref:DUF4376 domain-containing protein n=1 Tax=Alphaproteobacteria TaxID=28211 RepID=UPI00294328C4|nr:DUF4376 domain-containing protein [Sulfitobacter sp. LC.270.F.C4]WOI13559.1 DUF4376 domain-containing protein [Sulfitobacter sp. LC.270.F.C4]